MKFFITFFICFFAIVQAEKIEIKFDNNCNEKKIVTAFKSSKKIDFVKSDFKIFDNKEIDIIPSQGSTLSNDEIKEIAKQANCEVIFVEREKKLTHFLPVDPKPEDPLSVLEISSTSAKLN